MSAAGPAPPGRVPRLKLRRETVERIENALAKFQFDSERYRWKKAAADIVWVLSLHGRIGFGVVEVGPADVVDPGGAGWERASHWEAPSPGRNAFAVFFADGGLVTQTRYYRASKAVEVGLAQLIRCENAPAGSKTA